MKRAALILMVCCPAAMIQFFSHAQDSITDFDGNVYHPIGIGTQVWLRENLKSLHYSDGTQIPGVVAYNNSDSMTNIYGRLYSWNAAMKNSTAPGSQGACPVDWHIPTNSDWQAMDNYLGGPSVIGSKLKEEGFNHWLPPNTGATNSSGFTGLPAGEFDANQSQNFLFLGKAAVFWTSNQNGALMAIERYLSHDDAISGQLTWYKTMKYSIRCIRDVGTGNNLNKEDKDIQIRVSNPFTDALTITFSECHIAQIILYDISGKTLTSKDISQETANAKIETAQIPEGMYILEIQIIPQYPIAGCSRDEIKREVFKCFKIKKQ